MMFDPQEYEDAREALLGSLFSAAGLLALNTPTKASHRSEIVRARGYFREHAGLKALADQIEVIQHRFDMLCYACGAEDGRVRFGTPKDSHQDQEN